MDLKEINILLQKFFDGETTLEEEQQLARFFREEEIPLEWEAYRNFFVAEEELASVSYPGFDDQVMEHILEHEHQEKNRYRWLWQTVTSVAAVLIVALLAVNYFQSETKWKDTYKDPQQAYAEATKTIRYVAGKYQKGLAQLEPVRKIDRVSKTLQPALTKVNKGFDEVDQLNKMEKLKKE